MADSARFALHRPELRDSLARGDAKITGLMAGTARKVAAGETLIKASSHHEFVYRLVSGWACRRRTLVDGRQQCILIFLPGDLFGIKCMYMSQQPDDATTLSSAVVERVRYQDLHSTFLSDGDVANRCMWQVIEDERRLHNWVVSLGQGDAQERLALLLVDFHGRLALSGRIPRDARRYPMPLTQSQIADHLGLTSVHVNRVLKSFRLNGTARIFDGHVVIDNYSALIRISYPLLDVFERATPEFGGSSAGVSTSIGTSAARAPE